MKVLIMQPLLCCSYLEKQNCKKRLRWILIVTANKGKGEAAVGIFKQL